MIKYLSTTILLIIFASIFTVSALNTVERNGNWSSSGLQMEYPPLGAAEAFQTRASIKHNHLGLDLWGAQEFLLKQKGQVRSVEFDFAPGPDAALHFLFNVTDSSFDAVRFSINQRFPPGLISGTRDGKFLKFNLNEEFGISANDHEIVKTWIENEWKPSHEGILPAPTIPAMPTKGQVRGGKWNHVKLQSFSEGKISLQLGSNPPVILPAELKANTQIGFRGRGDQEDAWVDNISVEFEDGTNFHDDFSGIQLFWPVVGMIFVLVLFAHFIAVRRFKISLERLALPNAVLVSCFVSLFVLDWAWWVRQDWIITPKPHYEIRPLNCDPEEFTCVTERLKTKPIKQQTVVLMRSVWDTEGDDQYKEKLTESARTAKTWGSKIILVPMFFELPFIIKTSKVSRQMEIAKSVAENQGAEVADLHSFLEEKRNSGFIWWTSTILTPYGQKLAAEFLRQRIH